MLNWHVAGYEEDRAARIHSSRRRDRESARSDPTRSNVRPQRAHGPDRAGLRVRTSDEEEGEAGVGFLGAQVLGCLGSGSRVLGCSSAWVLSSEPTTR